MPQKKKYILALDQGTSSSRAILFNNNQEIEAVEQRELPQYFPQVGYSEQKPDEILDTQVSVVKRLLEKQNINPEEIAAAGITNQRETVIAWDKTTGKTVGNAIVWQDRRTKTFCNKLKKQGYGEQIKKTTGLLIDTYFSASKMRRILKDFPEARRLAKEGKLLFGTPDTWLIWNLTEGKKHITDVSNASRTMLLNIKTMQWDEDMLKLFEIPKNSLPRIVDSSGKLATISKNLFGAEIPITGIAGDQQAALFGQACFNPGEAKNTYGTGCFMLMNTGDKPVVSESGLLTTLAWRIKGKTGYALEGSIFTAGSAIRWLRDALQLIKNPQETSDIARSVENNGGVYFVPAFSGLGTPHWDDEAKGTITGLTQAAGKAHIVRATLEALAYQTNDVASAMQSDAGIKLSKLKADGGAGANNFLMQFQADILNIPVIRPLQTESTARGAAMLSGIGIGFWDENEINTGKQKTKKFYPRMEESKRQSLLRGWKDALSRSKAYPDTEGY